MSWLWSFALRFFASNRSVFTSEIEQWRKELEAAAALYKCPVEILGAICDRESGGGVYLEPPGPAGTGDNGHGHGLMQIDDRSHKDMLEAADWKDPGVNIEIGAAILMGEPFRGITTGGGYKALQNWPAAVCAYNAGTGAAFRALGKGKASHVYGAELIELNKVTTGGNYVSWVLDRARRFGWRG